MKPYFPLFASLNGRRVVVVGGGSVALRKIRLLLAAEAAIEVVAPRLHADVQDLKEQGLIHHRSAKFSAGHLAGAMLVVAATDKKEINEAVFAAANRRNTLCNAVDDPAHSSFITPAIVRRSPITIAISSGGAAPVLARMLREKLERELPQHLGRLAALAASWRDRVKLRLPGLTARRRFWERLFSGSLQTGTDTWSDERQNEKVEQLLVQQASTPGSGDGEAWLVGAGPGDPALLTLRAQQLLHRADVVLYDRLVSAEILDMARRDAEFIDVGKPLPGEGCASRVQQTATALLIDLVKQGQRVCRLKGGDPFIFGRGGEEVTALQEAGLPYQIVPGITAAAACAAYAGIPLTHRDYAQSVVLITGHGKNSEDSLDWPSLARDRQTLAVYMGVARYSQLSRKLMLHGRPGTTPIAIVERGTSPDQRVITGTLDALPEIVRAKNVIAPAILIIGEVANFALTQQWFGRAAENLDAGAPTLSAAS